MLLYIILSVLAVLIIAVIGIYNRLAKQVMIQRHPQTLKPSETKIRYDPKSC